MQKIIFFSFASFIMSLNSSGQSLNPNDLADKIITAFQKKDFESYKKLMLDTLDYKEFMNDFFKSNHVPALEQKQLEEKQKMFADSADLQYRKDFERLLRKGEKLGIDWTQIKRGKFVFKDDKPVNSDKKSLSGHLNFTYKNTTYVFFGIEAMELSSGYKLSEIRTVLKGGVEQYVNPDLLDDDDM
jgi:hypothetical protein